MDAIFHSPFAHVSLGAGLAVLSGLRALLPIAVFGLFAHLHWLSAPALGGTSLSFLADPVFFGLFFGVGLIEVVADKVPILGSAQDIVAIPLRMAAGAIVFGAALVHEGTPAMITGLVAGGAIAGAAHGVKSVMGAGAVASAGTAHPYISLMEDLAAMAGAVCVLLLPVLGIVLLALLVFMIYGILRRRRSKYRGLRILKD